MKSIRYYINLIQESELVEPKVTTQQVQNLNPKKLAKVQSRIEAGPFKSGVTAYAKELDPHQIKLTTFKTSKPEDDPKFQYINAVRQLMGENPYVPNVYEIKLVKGKNLPQEAQKPTYVIQKLMSYDNVPVLSLYAACKPIIKSCLADTSSIHYNSLAQDYNTLRNLHDEFSQSTIYSDLDDESPKLKEKVAMLTARCLRYIFHQQINSSDNDLNQVMDIIINLSKNSDFFYDLNINNFLFRPSPYGYQLVITDPLATIKSL